ncbi:SGNH hydrolase [Kickxella alabastrina]|uniref:SGNH hydrolase n=1 Tax=Kickxella alabastrina TaxID=61397 RepID=UPI002220D325|nr:SGNH hydrolase [Kickxella alabastrina]KAI7824448.1 SGNH hydrolase [Kickxella alabastrina]
MDQIICLGDSITQHGWDVGKRGWVAQLSQAYVRRLDVLSRGFSGYNTRWTTPLLAQMLPRSLLGTRLITVFFGANDAQHAPLKQHVPLGEFVQNTRAIIENLKEKAPFARIILITPPPVGDSLWAKTREAEGRVADRTNVVTRQYAAAVVGLAAELAVPCVDLWTVIETKREAHNGLPFAGYEVFSWDGLHLNENGNDVLFNEVLRTIRLNHADLDPDVLPFVLPAHTEIVEGTREELLGFVLGE